MCIVITKDKYVKMPSNNTLRHCWEANPQGAGYMVTDPTSRMVIGKKGFMKLDDLLKELSDPKLDKMNVIIHFRIATHGGVNPQATHPFPLSGSHKDLNALEWINRCGIAHNGIIPNYGTLKGLSDTQEFIKNVASKAGEHILHPGVLAVLESMIGWSKIAIMRRDKIVRIGKGWVKFKGCWFSNGGYKAPVVRTFTSMDEWTAEWKATSSPIVRKPIPVLDAIGTIPPFKVDPVICEPTGYRIDKNVKRPTWCNNHCLVCSYLEGGLCVMDEDALYLKEMNEGRLEG